MMQRATTGFDEAIRDLAGGLARWRIWTALAWTGIRTQYSRSLLGVLWITAAFALFILVKLLIFGAVFDRQESKEYSLYLIYGFFAFQVCSLAVSSAPMTLTASQGFIKNDALPLSLFAYRNTARELIHAALNLIVVIAFMIVLRAEVTATGLMSLLFFPLFAINAIWVKIFLGVVAARFRDIEHFVQSIMRLMFFLTPIFWMPEQVGDALKYLWWNPFFHFLEIFRGPLLYDRIAADSWVYVLVMTAGGWALTLITFAIARRRVVFWL
jgi:ABC-type polysaccharide/polyol phosphate export permease